MPFDPTKPIAGTEVDANELRAQFNGLKDLIDAIPAGPPGPQGPQGDPGPQGPMPPLNPLIAPGRIISDNGDFTLATNDAGGSGETSLIHSAETVPGGLIPVLTARNIGATVYHVRVDPAGIIDGAGTPSVQHNAVLIYDSASALWKPTLGVTQTLTVGDGSGGTLILQIVGGLIISVT